jgi:ribonucleotide monophosphatase NagD (HAD superfamily)
MSTHATRTWLIDMDGVIVCEEEPIGGSAEFLARLRRLGTPVLVLTNNSIYTARDLAARLRISGLDVTEDNIWTSALATARLLDDQRPSGSAFTIGEAGLTTALYQIGYVCTSSSDGRCLAGTRRSWRRPAMASDPSTAARDDREALRRELRELEERLDELRRELDSLREDLRDYDDSPTATALLYEQETLIETLEARRAENLQQLAEA